jgi:hypothetical protein
MGIADYYLESPAWDYWCIGLTIGLLAACLGVSIVRLIIDSWKLAIASNLSSSSKSLKLWYLVFLGVGITLLIWGSQTFTLPINSSLFGIWDIVRFAFVILTYPIAFILIFLSPIFGGFDGLHAQAINWMGFLGSSILITFCFRSVRCAINEISILSLLFVGLILPLFLFARFENFDSFTLLSCGASVFFSLVELMMTGSLLNSQKNNLNPILNDPDD